MTEAIGRLTESTNRQPEFSSLSHQSRAKKSQCKLTLRMMHNLNKKTYANKLRNFLCYNVQDCIAVLCFFLMEKFVNAVFMLTNGKIVRYVNK